MNLLKTSLLIPLLALGFTGCDYDTADLGSDASFVTDQGHFEIFEDTAGEFRFRLRAAGNNKNILASEGYTTKAAALKGLLSVLANADNAKQFEVKATKANPDEESKFENGWTWTLKAKNNKVIGWAGEAFNSKAAAQQGTEAVKNNAAGIRENLTDKQLQDLSIEECAEEDVGQIKGAHFEIFVDSAEEFRFRLRAANGEIILASEGYTSKQSAIGGAVSVITNSDEKAQFDIQPTESNEEGLAKEDHFFTLKAANGETIGVSEVYASKSNAKKGTQAVAAAAKLIATQALKALPETLEIKITE